MKRARSRVKCQAGEILSCDEVLMLKLRQLHSYAVAEGGGSIGRPWQGRGMNDISSEG
jgi:hypothetical protein